jgi:Ca2+/H+ antiporter
MCLFSPVSSSTLRCSPLSITPRRFRSSWASRGGGSERVARDTGFAAVMIVLNGVVRLCPFLRRPSTGRATVLQGTVHLVIFAAFMLVSAVP